MVELGMNHPGEIRTLVGIAQPEVRVWTNVGDAHAGFFASTDAIADAKGEILEGARAGDVLVANADDSRIAARAGAFAGRVMTFGIEHPADVRATDIEERGLDGIAARVPYSGRRHRPRDAAARARQPRQRARGGCGRAAIRRSARRCRRVGRRAAGGASPRRAVASARRAHAH